MNGNLVYVVSLVIVVNCVISGAKNSEDKSADSIKNVTDHSGAVDIKLNEGIYSEGGSSSMKGRIVARKGVTETSSEINQDAININNITNVSTSTTTNSTVNSTILYSVPLTPSTNNSTLKTVISSTVKELATSTTTTTTTTTKKPIRKPLVTHSADDDPEILASEKNINYNTSKIEDVNPNPPKTSQDTDRTIVDEESRTRRNYIIYMGLALALPMGFTLIHVCYKRIRNWMEIRHYQRVVSQSSIDISQMHANQLVNICRTFWSMECTSAKPTRRCYIVRRECLGRVP